MRGKFFILGAILATSQTLADPSALASDADVRRYNLGLGRTVFVEKCIVCHETGELGAPKFREIADWEIRLQQDLPSLIRHALAGHGKMPPKGGYDELTERQISAAVAYVVDQARRVIAEGKPALKVKQGLKTTTPIATDDCESKQNVDHCKSEKLLHDTLLLRMLWLLSRRES